MVNKNVVSELSPEDSVKLELGITKKCREISESEGSFSVYLFCEKLPDDMVSHEFCKECDAESPTLKGKHECLVCGSTTEVEPKQFSKSEMIEFASRVAVEAMASGFRRNRYIEGLAIEEYARRQLKLKLLPISLD